MFGPQKIGRGILKSHVSHVFLFFIYIHFFLDISIRMQNSPRLPGCMSVLIQVAVNYEIGRIFIYIYIFIVFLWWELCLESVCPALAQLFLENFHAGLLFVPRCFPGSQNARGPTKLPGHGRRQEDTTFSPPLKSLPPFDKNGCCFFSDDDYRISRWWFQHVSTHLSKKLVT